MRRFVAMGIMIASAGALNARVLVLDTFDDGATKNALGGATGAWDIDPDDKSVSCAMSFDSMVRRGDAGRSLRLDYDLQTSRENVNVPVRRSIYEPAQVRGNDIYNGYYSIFPAQDLSKYGYLLFSLKGDADKGFTRSLRVELKDVNGQSGVMIDGITDQWREFVIPFRRFKEIQDWSKMKEFVLVFGDKYVTQKKGAVYLDDVYFSSRPSGEMKGSPRLLDAGRRAKAIAVDGLLTESEWPPKSFVNISKPEEFLEFGYVEGKKDLSASFSAAWDDQFLYLAVKVRDGQVVNDQDGADIWKDDCIEVYIDPANDKFIWNNPKDFQIGFSPTSASKAPAKWAWFQNASPAPSEVSFAGRSVRGGYQMETAVAWSHMGVVPAAGQKLGFSVAVHDRDSKDPSAEAKLNWYYEPLADGRETSAQLGILTLGQDAKAH